MQWMINERVIPDYPYFRRILVDSIENWLDTHYEDTSRSLSCIVSMPMPMADGGAACK